MAIAMVTGALTPLTTAQADPVAPDDDVVVNVAEDISTDADAPQNGEILDTDAADAADEADPVAPDDDVAVDEAGPVAPDDDVVVNVSKDSVPGVDSTPTDTVDVIQETDAEFAETSGDADLNMRSSSNAVVPLGAEAAAVAQSRGLSSMRLRKSNGYWVTITPQMQANALVVIDTIKSAKWSGVSSAQKDRLIDVALMTMAQESTFYTHPYAHMPDRNQDVGPFQQRSKVGWYADGRTQAQNIRILNNIPYATLTFIQGHRVPKWVPGAAGPTGYIIPGVFQMRNWRTDPLWQVAANVQRPARQYRYHYEYWRPVVQQMVKSLKGYSSTPSGASDVYTTAGDHTVSGRKWRTACETYSQTIDRCTATIWATTVSRVNGKFVQKSDWQFNNLTYLPSKRAQWKGNPLATTGTFTSGGRSWRTSCADNWTGPNACRSFMQAHVIETYLDASGNRKFREVKKEIFNNVVRFSN